MKDGLTWLNNSRPNGFVEDGALTLDPMLGPSGRDIRSIPMPYPGKEKKDCPGFNRLSSRVCSLSKTPEPSAIKMIW